MVSVIIPAYNAARYIGETLESVRAQTYRNFEIIVIDDGSTDETAAIAQSQSDVRYGWQENATCGIARNTGVAMARGELLAFLDADDLWSADKLVKQVEFYQSLPATEAPLLIYGGGRQFFSPELDPQFYANVRLLDRPQATILASNLLVSHADFARIGPFFARLAEAMDWHLRAVDMGAQVHILPDVFLSRRIHLNNIGRTQGVDKTEYARVIKEALDRRRATAKS